MGTAVGDDVGVAVAGADAEADADGDGDGVGTIASRDDRWLPM